jgi:hypothetical protein
MGPEDHREETESTNISSTSSRGDPELDQLVASTESPVQYEREKDADEWIGNFGNMPVTEEDPVVSVPHENIPTPQERDSPVSVPLQMDHE